MEYRFKVRVTRENGTSARLAFVIDDGGAFNVRADTAGFEGLGGEGLYFRIVIEDGEAWVVEPSGRTSIVIGSVVELPRGKIEFLEVPEIPKAPVEESTRMVDLDAATRMVRVDAATRMISKPSKESDKAPEKTKATKSLPKSRPSSDSDDSVTGMIMRQSVDGVSQRETQIISVAASKEPSELTHVAVSLVTIAIFGELAAAVIRWVRPEVATLPIGVGAGLATPVAILVSLAGAATRGRFGFPDAGFAGLLRSFAIGSPLLVLWACSIALARIVEVFGVLLVSSMWMTLFLVRHQARLMRVSAVAASLVIALGGAGTWLRRVPAPGAQVAAAPAEAAAPTQRAPAAAPQAEAPVAQTPVSAPVPAAPAAAPVAAAPVVAPPAAAPAAPVVAIAPVTGLETAPSAPSAPGAEATPAAPSLLEMMDKLKGVTAAPAADPIANTSFFASIKRGDLDAVKRDVRLRKVDPLLALDETRAGALHRAAEAGHLEIVKYLVSRKVNLDARDGSGSTALMWAVFGKHREIVRFLLSKGADYDIRNDAGDKAFDIAARVDDIETLKVLRAGERRR